MVHPRVLRAMASPLIGHLDPRFLELMDIIQEQLRWLFHTRNAFTIAVSGTGSAGMETVIANLVEPGDSIIVGVNGVFGERIATMIQRCGGQPIRIDAPWGSPIALEHIEYHLTHGAPIKALAIVHAETSTGVLQPLAELGRLCRAHDALFIVDAVTSLGGIPLDVDAWHIDACYSATQKCLSCPPGLAPLTLSDRALAAIRSRTTPCHSWYLDCLLVADYWADSKRTYHHTAPISMLYALCEALCLIQEEGLEARFARHRRHSMALLAGLETLGFHPLPPTDYRLPSLTCVQLPPNLDEQRIRQQLLEEYGIEIGAGLGPLSGKVWRIGLMGESSRIEYVFTLLLALEEVLSQAGVKYRPGEAILAAAQGYQRLIATDYLRDSENLQTGI